MTVFIRRRNTFFLSGASDFFKLSWPIIRSKLYVSTPKCRISSLVANLPDGKRSKSRSVFPSANHLCSWAGVCPQNNETGGKRRAAKTKKGNMYLKAVLTQCVNSLSRSKRPSRFVSRFHSVKIRRGHNKAVIAVCRSMLITIYYMLSRNEKYLRK